MSSTRGAVWAALLVLFGAGAASGKAPAREPVVLEFFTSQGCATCPKANRLAAELAAEAGVLPLTFSVDYWDYLGWTDTLAKPEFTARQKADDQRLKVRELYTPEAVAPGVGEASAGDAEAVRRLISKARSRTRRDPDLEVKVRGGRLRLSGPRTREPLDVWLVDYDPETVSVRVRAGENKGQTVTIRNAVQGLEKLAAWRGGERALRLPPRPEAGDERLVLLQKPKGGAIVKVVRLGAASAS